MFWIDEIPDTPLPELPAATLPTRVPGTELAPAQPGWPRPVTLEDLGATADDTALTAELAAALRQLPVCDHCRGRHARACPRVKAMKWHPNGALASVAFWADDQWSDEHVVWPEDLTKADQ